MRSCRNIMHSTKHGASAVVDKIGMQCTAMGLATVVPEDSSRHVKPCA